jgi:hypothetical protein
LVIDNSPWAFRAVYQLLFDSGLSLSKIRDAALSGRLYHPTDDPLGVTGRSLAWKVIVVLILNIFVLAYFSCKDFSDTHRV